MKRVFCLMCFLVLSLIGCAKQKDNFLSFEFDKEGNYIGFSATTNYTEPEDAANKGFYVNKDGVFQGEKHWNDFCYEASNGDNASLRTIFINDDGSNDYIDLFYQDGLYYSFNSVSNNLGKKGYKYLLTLENDPSADGTITYYIILSNDNTLTYSKVFHDLASSEKYMNDADYKLISIGKK